MQRLSIDRRMIKVKKLGNIFRPYVVVGLLVIVLTIGIRIYVGAQSSPTPETFNRDEEIVRLYKEVTDQKQRVLRGPITRAETSSRFVEFTRLQIELLNSMDPR